MNFVNVAVVRRLWRVRPCWLVPLVGALVAFHGCATMTPPPPGPMITLADARSLLAADAASRSHFEGVIKAALPGLEGVVVNATLDVAVRAPAQLSVAVRSFFEVPQQILVASDGVVTLYDATDGTPRFSRGPASDLSLNNLVGLPLAPDDAVALLLGRSPLETTRPGWPAPRLRILDVDDQTFSVVIERAGRGAIHWRARRSDGAFMSATFLTGDGRAAVVAEVMERRDEGGVVFPQRLRVSLVLDHGSRGDVVLSVQEGRFNGPPLPPEAFVLEPPPGVPVSAL